MRSRALFAAVVLSTALVSGGWLVTRGLVGSHGPHGDNSQMFAEVYDRVARLYVDTLSDSALATRAADGLVSELNDPHSAYLSPTLLARLSERTTGRYAGIGAQVDVRDGWITIVAPLPGGPALAAGIQTGDRIVAVDGKPMRGVVLDEAQKALRGDPGSRVKLTIERPGVGTPMDFTLVRREIHVRSVQHAMLLPGNIGYVALTIFSQESVADLKTAIDSLRRAGMTSLIFDLRGDPGGLLDQGVGVADLFLDPGQRVVSMKGRTAAATRAFADANPQAWPTMPLAVLVDSNSASAAEIVSGALQDHDRALVLGTTTYGKGSAQNVFPLTNGGAVKLTTALWYTPSGRSINRPRNDTSDAELPDTNVRRPAYKTDAGRTVLGGGGITPDLIVANVDSASAMLSLWRQVGQDIPAFRDALTKYALSAKARGTVTSRDFTVTPSMRADFWKLARSQGVAIDEADQDSSMRAVDDLLGFEIARFVFGSEAAFQRQVKDDRVIATALELANGARSEQDLLARAAERRAARREDVPSR